MMQHRPRVQRDFRRRPGDEAEAQESQEGLDAASYQLLAVVAAARGVVHGLGRCQVSKDILIRFRPPPVKLGF